MKIYTKTGDKGMTSLASGKRVSKSNDLVELYGTCDELNSHIGVSISFLNESSFLKAPLLTTQNILFELGSELAGFRLSDSKASIIYDSDIKYLEEAIDSMQEKLETLRQFVLPGGSKSSAFLQVARTVCRRLERNMVKSLEGGLEIFEESVIYVNRLSDFLFVAGRYANYESGVEDVKWSSRAKSSK